MKPSIDKVRAGMLARRLDLLLRLTAYDDYVARVEASPLTNSRIAAYALAAIAKAKRC